MTVKEHYDNHLGNFYSWHTVDFNKNKDLFNTFCIDNDIKPIGSKYAIDLGAGKGIQTIALAEMGFKSLLLVNEQFSDERNNEIGFFLWTLFSIFGTLY